MAGEQLLLYAGILFLLIAVIGGGFSVKEVKIPRVAVWARIVSAGLGCFFIGFYFWAPNLHDGHEGAHVLREQSVGETSIHGLQVRNLKVIGPTKTPKVGDTITVEFTLVSVRDRESPVRLVATYVSSEDPFGNNKDFGWSRIDADLAKDFVVKARHDLTFEEAGVWTLWPCYALDLPGGTDEDDYCRHWNAFGIRVVE